MNGGLFDPLGMDRPGPAQGPRRPPASVVVAGLAVLALATLLAVAWLRDDGDRGRPRAVAPIERVDAPPKPSAAPQPAAVPASSPPTAAAPAAPTALPPGQGDQEVEIQNGVRIIRPRRGTAPAGGQTLTVPPPPASR